VTKVRPTVARVARMALATLAARVALAALVIRVPERPRWRSFIGLERAATRSSIAVEGRAAGRHISFDSWAGVWWWLAATPGAWLRRPRHGATTRTSTSWPLRPSLSGIDLPFVSGVQTLDDAGDLLRHLANPPPWAPAGVRRVVVVGGGYIGLEMAEAFVRRGASVTVVTDRPEVMTTLDPDMGAHVTRALRGLGIKVRCGTAVTGFEPGSVQVAQTSLPADLVVLGLGVAPSSQLAEEAGLTLGAAGAIRVDRRQRTSSEVAYAAGDCCTSRHLVSGREVHVALGTVTNKQARVAGVNLGGGYATFAGVLGTAVTKVCDLEVARTGLTEAEAAAAGFSAVAGTIESTTTAGYLKEAAGKIHVKVVAERGSGRLLGAQIVGRGPGAAKRIDVFATALTAGMECAEVAELDLGYAPPFSPLWDPVAIAARKVAALAAG